MTARSAARLAWSIAVACLLLILASVALLALDWQAIDSPFTAQVPWFANGIVVGVLGALVAARRPHNPIGWLMLAIAFGNAAYLVAGFFAIHVLLTGTPPTSGWVEWPAWFFNWVAGFGADLLVFLILLFPDGHLPGRRWRPVAWFAVAATSLLTVGSMLSSPATQLSPRLPNVPYPLNVGSLAWLSSTGVSGLILVPLLIAPAVAVVMRLRRATGAARLQLKWFALAAAAAIGVVIASAFLSASPTRMWAARSPGSGSTTGLA